MIHSARPIVLPVANIDFCYFVFLDLKSGDGRITCAKTIIPTGRDFGLAEWITYIYYTCWLRKKGNIQYYFVCILETLHYGCLLGLDLPLAFQISILSSFCTRPCLLES